MSTSDAGARSGAPAAVQALAAAHLGKEARVEPLAGDASTRAYFRARGAGGESAVVAAHEAAFDPDSFPFLETARLLEESGVRVPAVRAVDGPAGLILLEDLGDRTLQMEVEETGGAPDRVERLYAEAVEIIVRLQRDGTPRLHSGLHAGREVLDGTRFRFEMGYFLDHMVEGLRQMRLAPAQRTTLEGGLGDLCDALAGEPRVLCHRDFHSRNLMVTEAGALAVVDHQDARRGPDTYDLASLLRDPYVVVPEERVDRLVARYLAAVAGGEDPAAFRRRFHRMAVQRTLKAAGTFAAQKVLHGRDRYLRYLPWVLELARRSLAACPELAPLQGLLAEAVPELAP